MFSTARIELQELVRLTHEIATKQATLAANTSIVPGELLGAKAPELRVTAKRSLSFLTSNPQHGLLSQSASYTG
jgi:hypothetical protein